MVGAVERRARGDDEPADAWDLQRFAGLAARRPALAFAMAVFLLSLAGIPPTAGFVAKLYIFQAAVGAQLYGLAVVGVLTSVLGAYYYLRVVVYMYMRPAEGEPDALALAVDGGGARRRGGRGRAARPRGGAGGPARPGGDGDPAVAG